MLDLLNYLLTAVCHFSRPGASLPSYSLLHNRFQNASTEYVVAKYRLVLVTVLIPSTLATIALAAIFTYFGFRKTALDIGNDVDRLPCIIFVHFDTQLTLFHPFIGYAVRISIPHRPHPFNRFLDISILAWNAYIVRSMVSVIPP